MTFLAERIDPPQSQIVGKVIGVAPPTMLFGFQFVVRQGAVQNRRNYAVRADLIDCLFRPIAISMASVAVAHEQMRKYWFFF